MSANADVKNLVREYRKARGITQEDLAEKLGVSRQTIISIENGRYIPSLPLALKMARFFKCGTDELFSLEDG